MNIYNGIIQGLEEAVAYNEGRGKARTNTISISPVPDFEAKEIKSIRTELGMTQVLFAGLMGVSPKTVEAWEAGRNHPEGAACRLLSLTKADPQFPQKAGIVLR